MNVSRRAAAFAAGVMLSVCSPGAATAADEAGLDFTAIVVNGREIPAARVTIEIAAQKSASGILHGGGGTIKPAVVTQIISRVVDRELMVHEALRRGHTVSEQETELAWQREQGRWSNAGMFEKSLAIRGITREYLRERLAEDVLLHKLTDPLATLPANIPEKALREFYLANKSDYKDPAGEPIRYAFFSSSAAGASAQDRLRLFQARLNKGENFADLAREFSNHPSAAQGGLIDPQAALPFIEESRKLVRSQFSYPQTDAGGMHVYFRDREAKLVPFEQVREQVAAKAAAGMTSAKLKEFLAGLRKSAVVTYRK